MHADGKGLADKSNIGTVLYNRALVNAYYYTEAIRIAQGEFGNKPLTGEQIQWGMERLDITQEMIDEAGMTGLMSPVKITCSDHEGGGSARSAEHTSELPVTTAPLVCRLLLEKKKK